MISTFFLFRKIPKFVKYIFKYFFFLPQHSQSNITHVTLLTVTGNTMGKYECEVSADAPSFHTGIAFHNLKVVGK